MVPVKNKIVFITGATAGIGKACAELFAENGARLILSGRRKDRLEALAQSLKERIQTDSFVLPLDVADSRMVEEAIKGLPEEWRPIDILINNAGMARGLDKVHEASVTDWDEMIDTNIKGLLYVSRAVMPGMVARGSGHIVNLGSIAGHEVYPGGNVYCATKHAVAAITKGMQIDLVDSPVRVTTIDPGLVETEFSMVRFRGDEQRAKKVYQNIEALTGADVAEAVLFAVTRPPHVNIHEIIIMPTNQAGSMVVHRNPS